VNASTLDSVSDRDNRVSIPADLLRALDERAARDGSSREAILREALDEFLTKEQREAEAEEAHKRWLEEAHRKDVEGYTRFPQTPDEFDWSDVADDEL
jgi:predicted transcriptional regulator